MPNSTNDANNVPTLMGWDNVNSVMRRVLVDANGNVFTTPLVPAAGTVLPLGATQITASSGNQANANAVATLTGAVGKNTYITGFQCQSLGATAQLLVAVTVAGVITGTLTYEYVFLAGVTVQDRDLIVSFPTPVISSALNTNIVVTLPAGGGGNTNAICNAQGFLL